MDRIAYVEELARLDLDRRRRTGVPEAVFGERKELSQIVAIVNTLVATNDRVIVTRLPSGWADQLAAQLEPAVTLARFAHGRVAIVAKEGTAPPRSGGVVGLLAAGTADITVAEEARVTAVEMGCEVIVHYDVGVAGIHRLVQPLTELVARGAAVVIAVAGMEGALPTVVKSLLAVPVIGVPTSVSYGFGRGGEAALMAMLNTCSPGLTVVNIDNGFGAGASAALIANQIAAAGARSSAAQR